MDRTIAVKVLMTATFMLAGLLFSAFPAKALPWNEIGDAGELLGTAQETIGTGALTSITGSLSSGSDVDLFRIFISDPATFSASTEGTGTAVEDTQLFLFDAAGLGVYANDDSRVDSFLSTLPAGHANSPTIPGYYYLGITEWDTDPSSSVDLIFPSFPYEGVYGPTGPGGALPLSAWSTLDQGDEGGDYTITLTGASFSKSAVPEPAASLLLGTALAAFAAWRRQRQV